jgi:hypothetical protein
MSFKDRVEIAKIYFMLVIGIFGILYFFYSALGGFWELLIFIGSLSILILIHSPSLSARLAIFSTGPLLRLSYKILRLFYKIIRFFINIRKEKKLI